MVVGGPSEGRVRLAPAYQLYLEGGDWPRLPRTEERRLVRSSTTVMRSAARDLSSLLPPTCSGSVRSLPSRPAKALPACLVRAVHTCLFDDPSRPRLQIPPALFSDATNKLPQVTIDDASDDLAERLLSMLLIFGAHPLYGTSAIQP